MRDKHRSPVTRRKRLTSSDSTSVEPGSVALPYCEDSHTSVGVDRAVNQAETNADGRVDGGMFAISPFSAWFYEYTMHEDGIATRKKRFQVAGRIVR